jgi:hypothetical protein
VFQSIRVGVVGVGVLALGAGCDDPNLGSSGRVVLTANGGNEAREGIDATRFSDGYAVEYDHALLSVSSFHLRTLSGENARVQMPPRVVDLIPAPAQVFEVDDVPAQRWDEVGFSSHPPSADSENLNAPRALFEAMIEGGYSFLQTGRLMAPDGTEIPFELGFPVEIDYFACTSGDGTYGIVVPPNGTADAEITWHLTHLWFDSFAEDSAFRAEAVAAVWDGQHPVRSEDLQRQALGSLRGADGKSLRDAQGNPVIYIPPQEPGVNTLRDFILRARFGHFNGLGGSCTTEVKLAPAVLPTDPPRRD